MTQPPPQDDRSHGTSQPNGPYADGATPTGPGRCLLIQLDQALEASPPVGLSDAVLAATCDGLLGEDLGVNRGPGSAELDTALAPVAVPPGLADAVIARTRTQLPVAGGNDVARYDAATAPPVPPNLADAVLAATQSDLPVAAPVGRIGWGGGRWSRALALAAVVGLAAGVWWLWASGDRPGFESGAVVAGEQGVSTEADLSPEAWAESVQAVDRGLVQVAMFEGAVIDPVERLGERLVAVMGVDPWADSGFSGLDRAVDWEVSMDDADDGAWLF